MLILPVGRQQFQPYGRAELAAAVEAGAAFSILKGSLSFAATEGKELKVQLKWKHTTDKATSLVFAI